MLKVLYVAPFVIILQILSGPEWRLRGPLNSTTEATPILLLNRGQLILIGDSGHLGQLFFSPHPSCQGSLLFYSVPQILHLQCLLLCFFFFFFFNLKQVLKLSLSECRGFLHILTTLNICQAATW